MRQFDSLSESYENVKLIVSGKRGITNLEFRNYSADETYTQFEDEPLFEDVKPIADQLLDEFIAGRLDRLDVVYTKFISSSKQAARVETLLPLGSVAAADEEEDGGGIDADFEFFPSAESILEEVVPMSFRINLFKCFLDAAVSEQIARMVAMKSATENADDMIRNLSMTYNRARQSQITGEIMEIIGGVEALKS
jgi:F-type H+-transporting ATPase subunit gamma